MSIVVEVTIVAGNVADLYVTDKVVTVVEIVIVNSKSRVSSPYNSILNSSSISNSSR